MKLILNTLIYAVIAVNAISQNVYDKKYCKRMLPVKKEDLQKVNFMSDMMGDYPKSYYNSIIDYLSVGLSVTANGTEQLLFSSNDTLSASQKQLLSKADQGSDICLFVKFKYKDTANNNLGTGGPIKEMNFVTMAVPYNETEFPGGLEKAKNYLRDYVTKKLGEDAADKLSLADITFWVNETGRPVDLKIVRSSTDTKIDQLLIEAASNMPDWKPASNSKGTNIKQLIVIALSNRRC